MGILIKNGRVITATEDFTGDVYVDNGQIAAIGKKLDKANRGDVVIDASGQFVFPGGVDVHTHLDLPFMGTSSSDDFETGTIAAAAGGTTSIIDFAIPVKGQGNLEALNIWHEKAKGKAVIDYSFHMAVVDWNEKTAAEMAACVEGGITSFKTFMAYKGALQLEDDQLFHVLETAKKLGALVTVHAENADVILELQKKFLAEGKTAPKYHPLSRPPIVEAEATGRAIDLARLAEQPLYVVHVTAAGAVGRIQCARGRYQTVYGETCPQYLLLTRDRYEEPGFNGAKYVMSPPLREKEDQEALWNALRFGFIQTVATDHCPFMLKDQKTMGKDNFAKIPNGCPGIENRQTLMYTYGVAEGRLSLQRFVDITATAPAKIFGMFPKKGTIAVGSDADLGIYDPTHDTKISAKTHHHHCDYNTFEGFRIKGRYTTVISNGKIVFQDGRFRGEKGAGRFLRRSRVNWGLEPSF